MPIGDDHRPLSGRLQRRHGGAGRARRPTSQPHVTDHMDAIVGQIGDLIEQGCAYAAEGHVLFDIQAFPTTASCRAGTDGRHDRRRPGRGRALQAATRTTSCCGSRRRPASRLADALGRGAARLAHRVLGHDRGRRWACRSTSTAAASTWSSRTTRTRSPRASAPTATATRAIRRTLLDAQRLPDHGRREDVQERSATSCCCTIWCRPMPGEVVRWALLSAPLSPAAGLDRRADRAGQERAGPALSGAGRLRPLPGRRADRRAGVGRRARRRDPGARRGPGRPCTTISTRRRPSPGCSSWPTTCARRRWARTWRASSAAGRCCWRPGQLMGFLHRRRRDLVPGRRRRRPEGEGRGSDRRNGWRRAPPRTGRKPTASAASCRR